MSMAWHAAAFQRAEKLPKLDRVLIRPKDVFEKPQSMDEQRALMNALSEQFGIPLRKTRLMKAVSKHGR